MSNTRERLSDASQKNRDAFARRGCTLAGQALWTDAEISSLRSCWPDIRKLVSLLPDRSEKSIVQKAYRLGLKTNSGKSPPHVWTMRERRDFVKLWKSGTDQELREAFPFATWDTMSVYARYLKRNGYPSLSRPKRSVKTDGAHPVAVAVVKHAAAQGMNLTDLDYLAKGNGYFTNGWWRKAVAWSAIMRAVELFDGDVTVTFSI